MAENQVRLLPMSSKAELIWSQDLPEASPANIPIIFIRGQDMIFAQRFGHTVFVDLRDLSNGNLLRKITIPSRCIRLGPCQTVDRSCIYFFEEMTLVLLNLDTLETRRVNLGLSILCSSPIADLDGIVFSDRIVGKSRRHSDGARILTCVKYDSIDNVGWTIAFPQRNQFSPRFRGGENYVWGRTDIAEVTIINVQSGSQFRIDLGNAESTFATSDALSPWEILLQVPNIDNQKVDFWRIRLDTGEIMSGSRLNNIPWIEGAHFGPLFASVGDIVDLYIIDGLRTRFVARLPWSQAPGKSVRVVGFDQQLNLYCSDAKKVFKYRLL
jgi:hypothetical protein